jgi:hypothetical protein
MKIYCSHCKGYFDPIQVIKQSINKLTNKQYYWCNICNTERLKKYRSTKEGMEKISKAVYKSTKKHQNKQDARKVLNNNLKLGNIKKPKYCEACNKKKLLQAHHHDYTKPLDVLWLCNQCHSINDNRKEWVKDLKTL